MPNADKPTKYPAHIRAMLDRLCGDAAHEYACHASNPDEFAQWQASARPAFQQLLGLPRIEAGASRHTPRVTWGDAIEQRDEHTCAPGWIETEPGVRIGFWLLTPRTAPPWPVAITPHGHGGGKLYVGHVDSEAQREAMHAENRDVAVQAAQRGYLTIAPATRGLDASSDSQTIRDIPNRASGKDCRYHNWVAIAAGRTAVGERVWDMMRLIDWALQRDDVDPSVVLMVGNSGGGMVTAHAAAADPRINIAVPCCAYNNYFNDDHIMRHCPCNLIPAITTFGEYWDVAGLTAPRHMLTVNGNADKLHPVDEVQRAADRLSAIYAAAGAPDRYAHRFGEGGHRFYSDLMWPWIEDAARTIRAEAASRVSYPSR